MIVKKNQKYHIQPKLNNNIDIKIDWSIFDKIYCIHYLPYKERKEHAILELKRIGIYDQPQFEFLYTVPNKYYDALIHPNCFDSQIDYTRIHKKNINLQINRLNAIRKAQLVGYNRILILEDDNLFHKDISLIAQYLKNFPLQYDIVNMDYWFYDKTEFITLKSDRKNYINTYFIDTQKIEKIWNMSFISLTNKAMKYLCESQEKLLRPMDNYIAYKKINDDLAKDIKFAISDMNLSIQKLYDNRQNYHNPTYNKYYGQGLIFEDYI